LQVGRTLMLYRTEQHQSLEALRFRRQQEIAVQITSFARRSLAVLLKNELSDARGWIKEATVAKDEGALKGAIEYAEGLKRRLHDVTAATQFLERLQEQAKVRHELEDFAHRDESGECAEPETIFEMLEEIKAMLSRAADLDMESEEVTAKGRELCDRLGQQVACMEKLHGGTEASEKTVIEECLLTITGLEGAANVIFCAEMKAAGQTELARIAHEDELTQTMRSALTVGKVENAHAGEGTEEIDLTSTSYEELQQSVTALKEFEPRTAENKRMLSLGVQIVELRRALLKDDWVGAKAAVVALNTSELGDMPEAQTEMHVVQVRSAPW
jgi:hypothetical protein